MSRTKKYARRDKRNSNEEPAGPIKKKQMTSTHNNVPAVDPAAAASSPNNDREWAEKTLINLLGGMSIDAFLTEYFEKKPLHVRKADKGMFFKRKLFSRKKMLQIMEKQAHPMRLGKDLAVCRYVNLRRETFEAKDSNCQATSRQVASLLDNGYSCQFYQPQRYVDGLYELNAAFEEVFGGLAGSSAYLTPANSQALAPHHDDVEVFILQTQGQKKWKLYHPLIELAGEHSLDLTEDQIGEPWMELTMDEGDVLYFPRGVIHQACTGDRDFSTHVTISVYQHNSWANFMEVALPRIIRRAFDSDVSFRKGLPVGYLGFVGSQFPMYSAQAKDFTATCKKLVTKLANYLNETDLQEAADEAAMDVLANCLPPPAKKKSNDGDESGPSPLDSNVTIRFKNRSHIRLSIGEDEMKEAFAAVYFSLFNCRRHHMGLCTCDGEYDSKKGNDHDENEEESESDEIAEMGSVSGDQSDEDNHDLSPAFGQISPQPRSIIFPGGLAPALMKLYASSAPTLGATLEELAKAAGDMTSVSGMLLRLWSEGLVDVISQS